MKYNVSYPYPVLGVNDDVYPLLGSDCIKMGDPIKTPTLYKFTLDLVHHNADIAELIKNGYAEYACEIECRDTLLRKCIHSRSPHFDINLDRKEVCGRINFYSYIAVLKPIPRYVNAGFNEDYKGFSFSLEKGDLLVLFPPAFWNTQIKYDKLYAAGSFMQIVEAAEGIDKTWFNLDESKILIELPKPLFRQYQRIGNMFPEVIHSSLVHNALVYALINLESYRDSGKLWADSLIQRIHDEPELLNYDLTNPMDVFKMADQLLRDPYKRLLNSLEKLNDKMNIEGEED